MQFSQVVPSINTKIQNSASVQTPKLPQGSPAFLRNGPVSKEMPPVRIEENHQMADSEFCQLPQDIGQNRHIALGTRRTVGMGESGASLLKKHGG